MAMEEQYILRVPPSVAERIERLMNESTVGSSSNPEDASLDLLFTDVVMVREENDPTLERIEYKHGVTPPMRDVHRRRYRREPDLSAELVHRVEKDLISIMRGVSIKQNPSVVGAGEAGDRKKGAPSRAAKLDSQEPTTNGEAEAERTDESEK